MSHRIQVMQSALAAYKQGSLTLKEIAATHGVSTASVSIWALHSGLPRRRRGSRIKLLPSAEHQAILRLVHEGAETYAEIGKRFGLTRQAVCNIAKRWAAWTAANLPPRPPAVVVPKVEIVRPIRKLRSKVVSFRTTEEEFEMLESASHRDEGRTYRSVGDFVRAVVDRAIIRFCSRAPGAPQEVTL